MLMTVYQILTLVGVPSIVAGCLAYFWKRLKDNAKETAAVKMGVQALLRAGMIRDWEKYSEQGFAPIHVRDNFENCWKHYHALGVNGVMDDIHERFMQLPTERGNDYEK